MGPLVSVITASFNKEKFIRETIQSVVSQDYQNWELIVVDDKSSDNTISIVKSFLSDPRISLEENSVNRGANYCRNAGLKKSKGAYVIFLDADDLLSPDCLKNRINVASQNPGVNLCVFTMGVFCYKVGDSEQLWIPNSKDPLKDFLQHKLPWSILQPFWKTDFLIHIGGFDESFKRLEDVELNTRALLDSDLKYKLVPGKADCYYRIDEARKNFNVYNFLNRWVDSSLRYSDKFSKIAPKRYRKYLMGTVYQTYYQLFYRLKAHEISVEEFQMLETKLLSQATVLELNFIKKKILRLAKLYHLYFVRVPGINMLFRKLIVI